MNQPEKFQSSGPFDSALNHFPFSMGVDICGYEFLAELTNAEDYSGGIFSEEKFSSELELPGCEDTLGTSILIGGMPIFMEEFEAILYGGGGDQVDGSDASFPSPQRSPEWSPCPSSGSLTNTRSLIFPGEIEHRQTTTLHLLRAYGEAVEEDQRELREVISRSICDKGNPLGETLERLAFNLFENVQGQGGYLKQESRKNFAWALEAFYQIFPYGRFAHFAANFAILEAMPGDADKIHIVDFDMGDGVQWPPLIEAIGKQHKKKKAAVAVRLTSIKWGEEGSCSASASASAQWRFEETRKRLCNHARSVGQKLTLEEVRIEDLARQIKKRKTRGGRAEWLAFNCMLSLPHMGRRRSHSKVMNFLTLANSTNGDPGTGILTFGNGDPGTEMTYRGGYGAFFDGHLAHYQALMESIEGGFPAHLGEARMAMESLFVAPYVSSVDWFHNWEEAKQPSNHLPPATGWTGSRLSIQNLTEATELVKQRGTSYRVNIQGPDDNEMVLEWKGTPLVRLSTWT